MDEPTGRPQMVKVATFWEIVEGEMKGQYLIEPNTEDDLREIFLQMNIASATALAKIAARLT